MSTSLVPGFIGGQFVEGETDGVPLDPVYDPATGETIATLPHSTTGQIEGAVRAATAALPDWADTPPPDRAQVMFRFKHLLEEHFEELSLLVVQENGKTLPEARGEVRRGIEVVELACGAPSLLMGTNLD